MRFLPCDLPTVLGYVAGLLVITAPSVIPSTQPAQQAPAAQVCQAGGDQVAVVAVPSVLNVVERGVVAQFTVFVCQIAGAVVARIRPAFLDTSEHELQLALVSARVTR